MPDTVFDDKVTLGLVLLLWSYSLIVLAHAAFVSRSQFSDYGEIKVMKGYRKGSALRKIYGDRPIHSEVNGEKKELDNRLLFRNIAFWIPLLRIMAYFPFCLFLFSAALYVFNKNQVFKTPIKLSTSVDVLAYSGCAIIVMYFGIKLFSGICSHLLQFHPLYNSRGPLPVWMEVFPTTTTK